MLGIERIKILGSEVKDKALLKVIEYLVSREDMNEKYLNEEKSLKQMVEYIKSEAKKQAVNGMAMIKDCVYSEDGITYMSDKQYNNYINIIEQLQQENQELKDNWIKLRETLKNEQLGSILYSDKKRFADIDEILLKIQELEKGGMNE